MERLEVRLDAEHHRRLRELAAARKVTVSELVRQLIDAAYAEVLQTDRLRAARELTHLAVEVPPDPDRLNWQLDHPNEPNEPNESNEPTDLR